MDIDLRYYKNKGIYVLNGTRVILLPSGSLELIQDYVSTILGLATKSIFEDAMATTIYSFVQDMINAKTLKLRGERSDAELFTLIQDMGLGHISLISKDAGSYSLTIDKCFNSTLSSIKQLNSCFQADGILAALYRLMLEKEVKVTELKCKSTGNSDADLFEVNTTGEKGNYTYIKSPTYQVDDQNFEKIDMLQTEVGVVINSIPVEIVPVIFFPYVFSRLRKIIGMGVYGIQYGIGTTLSKLYMPYPISKVAVKYQVDGFSVLSPLAGVGLVQSVKNDFGGLKEIDIYDSFNSLHTDEEAEKRCFLLSGILTGLSYLIMGTNLKLRETDCAAVNNSVCKFSFD